VVIYIAIIYIIPEPTLKKVIEYMCYQNAFFG